MSRSYSPDETLQPEEWRESPKPERSQDQEREKPEQGRGGSSENHLQRNESQEVHQSSGRTIEPRQQYKHRKYIYHLRSSEIETMADIGKFRAIAVKDLEEFAYRRDKKHLETDLRNLRSQGLIVEREIPHQETSPRRLLALTKEGSALLKTTKSVPKEQEIYHGFTKPREAHHDADLYRLYQHGLEKIHRQNGRNVRVVLDSELKKNLYRDLARAEKNKNPSASADVKTEVAERHHLRVVRGKIPVPDLRIEYETQNHEPARVDLELATEHYRFRSIAQKVRAGFSIYARSQDAANLRRVLDQRELTAEILSL